MELTIFTAHHCRTNRTQETLVIKISSRNCPDVPHGNGCDTPAPYPH